MATWTLTVGGTGVTPVVDVEPGESDEDRLTRAKVTVGNTSDNRAIESGDDATINKNGGTEMVGKIAKKPTVGDAGDFIELHVADNRYGLTLQEVHRPFVNMDSGDIIREAINNKAEQRSSVLVHRGEGPGSSWTTDIPVFELADFSEKRFREYGSNMIFAGWREGDGGEYTATYGDVPSAAIPGSGQVSVLRTRLLANNTGAQIQGEVELRDNAGTRMIWRLPQLGTNFETYELRAEDAEQSASIGLEAGGNGVLEYRFKLKGQLSEPRAVLIDHAETLPFALQSRSTDVTTGGVQDSNREITRRFDSNIMEMIRELGEEDGFMSFVDENDVLHYEPEGDQTTSRTIDYNGGTPVVEAENEKDYDRIVNKLTVIGSGDVQVTVSNESSIAFYGVSERENQLVDKELQTETEARERGQGILEDTAWHDSALTFQIGDTRYSDVRVGESMSVVWPPFDVDGEFIVSDKEVKPSGIVELSFTGFTG